MTYIVVGTSCIAWLRYAKLSLNSTCSVLGQLRVKVCIAGNSNLSIQFSCQTSSLHSQIKPTLLSPPFSIFLVCFSSDIVGEKLNAEQGLVQSQTALTMILNFLP